MLVYWVEALHELKIFVFHPVYRNFYTQKQTRDENWKVFLPKLKGGEENKNW